MALAVLAVIPSAAARTPQPTADPALANVGALAPVKTVDLLSVPKIKTYLRSLGIDPSGVAIQRGAKNYAGPNCPGASWNCTTATKVVQLAARVSDDDDDEPENRFVCKPAGTGTHPATNTCMIVQPGPNSNNSATCDIETHQAEGTITQTCFITQTGKRNSAYARQVAGMSASGTDQDVFQTISVKQTSGTGGNTLETAQSALLRSHGASGAPVMQDVHQTTCANQVATGTGPNSAKTGQSQILFAQKKGAAAVDIAQNTALDPARCDEGGGPAAPFPTTFGHLDTGDCAITTAFSAEKGSASACTRIHQTSCATSTLIPCTLGSGKNTIRLAQLESMLANVDDTTGVVNVTQGNFDGIFDPSERTGTDATLDQESTAASQIFFGGLTGQVSNVPSTADFVSVLQTDFGPRCCAAGHQFNSTSNTFDIDGRLFQRALVDGHVPANLGDFPGFLSQEGGTYGDCETSGACTVDLAASNNADSNTAQCGPDTSCHVQVECNAVVGEGVDGSCQPPDISSSPGARRK